ncbi:MAG: hypothetical protein PVI30_17445 [Myxococcales bacterium]|jgi:hypothetical protein
MVRRWGPLLCLLPLLAIPTPSRGQGDGLERRELLDGRLSLRVPRELSRVADAEAAVRYGGRTPDVLLAREGGSTEVAVDHTDASLADRDVEALCEVVPSRLDTAGFELLGAEVRRIGSVRFCVVDFRRPVAQGALRVTRAMGALEGRYLAITLTVAAHDEKRFQALRRRVLSSIDLRPTPRGAACEAGAAQKCADADHHALCSGGKWKWVDCGRFCAPAQTVGCLHDQRSHEGRCACVKPAP